MKTPEGKTKMDKQQVLNQLRNAKEIYVIMSLCTKMPYVVCDKETFDDEVLLYFKEEDIRREGKRLIVIEKEALPGNVKACRILPAGLGEKIGDIAALSVAMHTK